MMMEAVQEEVKTFSCKVCRECFPSGPALGGHMRCHFSGNLKRKTKSDFEKFEEEVAIALVALKMTGSMKSELLEIDIPESGVEEPASKSLSVEMWPKEREKIQVTDPAPEEKDKIVPSPKKRKMADRDVSLPDMKREKIHVTVAAPEEKDKIVPSAKKKKMADRDVSLPDLKRVVYECSTCHRTFRSQHALGAPALAGREAVPVKRRKLNQKLFLRAST